MIEKITKYSEKNSGGIRYNTSQPLRRWFVCAGATTTTDRLIGRNRHSPLIHLKSFHVMRAILQ